MIKFGAAYAAIVILMVALGLLWLGVIAKTISAISAETEKAALDRFAT
jgi:hypothetical protein